MKITDASFGTAIDLLKAGKRVARKGWNGKGMWLTLIHADGGKLFDMGMGLTYLVQDCIAMKTVDNLMQPGWLASQADMLAEDWQSVD